MIFMSIKIGIVGTGGVARNSYLPYLSQQKEITIIYYSRTQAKAEECARDFGGTAVQSIQDLLKEKCDSILVLTNETQRYKVVKDLLKGKPKRLFFEKPLVAENGQDKVCEDDFYNARELLEQARDSGTETAMVFNYRFFSQTVRMQKIIKERRFGKLTQASLFVNYACWSHCIDLLLLFGGPVSVVSALTGNVPYKNAADIAGSFILENGASGTILGTNGTEFDLPLYHMIFNFEHGSIKLNDLDGPMEVLDNSDRYSETYKLIGNNSRWDQYDASFGKSLSAYLDSIRKEEKAPVPGEAGLEELQFEVALRRSAEQVRPVNVQEEFPLKT